MPLHILRTSTPRPRVPEAQLGFGQVFTDHMLLMDYTTTSGLASGPDRALWAVFAGAFDDRFPLWPSDL